MTDLHRRDVLRVFLPAIAAEVQLEVRDAYVRRLAILTELPADELRRLLLRYPERPDPEALRVLGSLVPARGIRP